VPEELLQPPLMLRQLLGKAHSGPGATQAWGTPPRYHPINSSHGPPPRAPPPPPKTNNPPRRHGVNVALGSRRVVAHVAAIAAPLHARDAIGTATRVISAPPRIRAPGVCHQAWAFPF
jgi:hypothetical protein